MGDPNLRKRWRETGVLVLILAGVFALYAGTLTYGFLDFDDGVHVTQDPVIRSLDAASIQKLFTRTISGVYIPLTSLSFALEHHFFGFEPFIFHLNNVLLYLVVIALAYGFGLSLGLKPKACLLATLLFAVHPMHVESVAWVSERKDMLYSIFYLGALIAYCGYLKEGRLSRYIVALVFGLLSLLAKPTAATLPMVLLLCDWYFKRPLRRAIILDKIPFVVYTVPLIWITYNVHPHPPIEHGGEGILIFIWSFAFYLIKFFMPLHLAPYYPLEIPVSIVEPSYALGLSVVVLFILLLIKLRKERLAVFAGLFYAASIVIILRYANILGYGNNALVADRFMFLAGLGFCLLLGAFFSDWMERDKRRVAHLCAALLVMTLTAKTAGQCRIWKDDVALFSAAIEECPTCYRLYVSRWKAYKAQGKTDFAAADFRKAAALKRQQFTLP